MAKKTKKAKSVSPKQQAVELMAKMLGAEDPVEQARNLANLLREPSFAITIMHEGRSKRYAVTLAGTATYAQLYDALDAARRYIQDQEREHLLRTRQEQKSPPGEAQSEEMDVSE